MARSKTLILSILAILVGGFLIFRTSQSNPLSLPQQPEQLDDQTTASINITTDSEVPTPPAGMTFLEEANLSLQASISSLLTRIEQLEQEPPQDSAIGAALTPTTVFQPQTIYLGSASSMKHEWTDTGVAAAINTANYPSDVTVVFEAGLSVPGGEAWARLKNKTTGAVLSITQVWHNNDHITWKSSPPFKLHSGYNTYEVQLRSTSGETINLSGARLKISR